MRRHQTQPQIPRGLRRMLTSRPRVDHVLTVEFLGKCRESKTPGNINVFGGLIWLRGLDLNQRPSGYEPDELPDCSTPRQGDVVLFIVKGVIGFPGSDRDVCFPVSCLLCSVPLVPSHWFRPIGSVHGGPGGDLLSHALRRSTIGAEGFHGRVRDGIGWFAPRCGHQTVDGRFQGTGNRDQVTGNRDQGSGIRSRFRRGSGIRSRFRSVIAVVVGVLGIEFRLSCLFRSCRGFCRCMRWQKREVCFLTSVFCLLIRRSSRSSD